MGEEPKLNTLGPYFKLALMSVMGLIVIFLIIISYIAIWAQNPPTDIQKDLYAFSKDTLKVLIGAFVGLVSGKTL